MAFPVETIADILFANQQKDRLQGLEIWTDQSLLAASGSGPSQSSFIRVQVVPQNIQFAQRARISEQIIKDGRAFFFWRKDRKSSHLDLMEIQLSGITRSLAKEKQGTGTFLQQLATAGRELAGDLAVPGVGQPPPPVEGATPKQREWLRFWQITRQSYVTETGINQAHIRLNTPALPGLGTGTGAGVEFVGHFSAPIQFNEVADNPFLVTWNLSLIVHYTVPDLDQFFDLIQAQSFTVTGG